MISFEEDHMRRARPWPVYLLLLLALFLTVSGCGKDGSPFSNQNPTIEITSYVGEDSVSTTMALTPFKQKIFWNASDADGVIKGFAYRVMDVNGNPIATPGNSVLDETGEFTPDALKAISGSKYGWILHYREGADESIPLTSSAAKKTIWTSDKYAEINFPAANATGDSIPQISEFQVVAIDNKGGVSPISHRIFKATSQKPRCALSTAKGDPAGKTLGTGVTFTFNMLKYVGNNLLEPIPFYYEYRLSKVSATDSLQVISGPSEWYSTYGQANVAKATLTKNTTPALVSDYQNGAHVTRTRMDIRVKDLAGIYSNVMTKYFTVKEGFAPETLIYTQRLYVLGDNHYIDYPDQTTEDVLPSISTESGAHYGTPFFKNHDDGIYTAVNSNNLKVYVRWGWHGEYGTINSSNIINVTDNPFDRKIDQVNDQTTDANYYTDVVAFDIRLDGAPYVFGPLDIPSNYVTDNDGKRWLRAPVNSEVGQKVVLTNMTSGNHKLEVRAVDLQGVADPTPEVLEFNLVRPVPRVEKSGILIVDEDNNSNSYSPDTYVDSLYTYIADYNGVAPSTIKLQNGYIADDRTRRLGLHDIQQYKLVIYHSDNPSVGSQLSYESDALRLYLAQGGNVVISGSSNLSGSMVNMYNAANRMMSRYFGIKHAAESYKAFDNSFNGTNFFFQKAVATSNGYSDMSVNTANAFNSMVRTKLGLPRILTITPNALNGATKIYAFGCKTVGTANGPTTQADYNTWNNQTVGTSYQYNNSSAFLIGFPISYMDPADAKTLMSKIITQVMSK